MAKCGAGTKLGSWCADRRINYTAGARSIGTVPDTFRRYVLGQRLPRPEHMRSIYLLTAGQVTPNDFYDLPPLPDSSGSDEAGCECRRVA